MACHQVDATLVGPALKDIAEKYKSDPAAIDALSKKVKEGGSGVWADKLAAPIPMPPNAAASDEDIRAIVTWIMTL